MSLLQDEIADIVSDGLEAADVPIDLIWKTVEAFQVRASAGAAIAATTISLGTLPSGLTATMVGDVFIHQGTTYTIAAAIAAAGGVISGVTFGPALASAVASGAVLSLRRETVRTGRGFDEQISARNVQGDMIKAGDWRFLILASSAGAPPAQGDKILQARSGRWLTVVNVGADPAVSIYDVLARS